MVAEGDGIRVEVLWPTDEPLALPGFDLDDDEKLARRRVEPDEAVAAARTALDALGVGPGDPLLIHLGAERPTALLHASRSQTSTCSTLNEARSPGIARVRERG